ncbi:hypothetical protein CDAR_472591 [Caerostris darwini]|uniref:Uncharacterized protein n=1 Tax=Caerostris darwini TaxID=1538125 RepID=A0AAV4TLF3_9ARAC|nr:hypothetical protein CDAR_302231 [Caerostris darwini]GIY46029.1 hypothetical protein CDAR_472591 [Caerostris darwini]
MNLMVTFQLSKKCVIIRNPTYDLILFSSNIISVKKCFPYRFELMICSVRGKISDSVITFMASYSPEHSDGGIDHSDPLGCNSRKVQDWLSDSLLSLCARHL